MSMRPIGVGGPSGFRLTRTVWLLQDNAGTLPAELPPKTHGGPSRDPRESSMVATSLIGPRRATGTRRTVRKNRESGEGMVTSVSGAVGMGGEPSDTIFIAKARATISPEHTAISPVHTPVAVPSSVRTSLRRLRGLIAPKELLRRSGGDKIRMALGKPLPRGLRDQGVWPSTTGPRYRQCQACSGFPWSGSRS